MSASEFSRSALAAFDHVVKATGDFRDRPGQRLMAQAGFDPRQAVGLWQNMMAASANRPPQWLSTHPDPANRIRELERDAPSLVPTYEAARKAGNVPKCG